MKKLSLLLSLVLIMFFSLIIACAPQKVVEKQFVCADGRVVNSSEECVVKNVQVVEEKKVDTIVVEQKQTSEKKQDVEEKVPIEYTFTLQQIRDMDKKLIGKRAVVLSDTMGVPIWINNSYTFGYAVQSDFVKQMQFKLDIKFLEARTKTNGRIGADELTEKWFLGVEGMKFNLSKGEKKYIPLTLKVWDIVNKDSLSTFEGTYTFDVVLYSKDFEDESNFNDVYTTNRLYVLVGK